VNGGGKRRNTKELNDTRDDHAQFRLGSKQDQSLRVERWKNSLALKRYNPHAILEPCDCCVRDVVEGARETFSYTFNSARCFDSAIIWRNLEMLE